MTNDYVFGRSSEYDKIRTDVNISKVLQGKVGRKKKVLFF
jgi:hypothetical protein